jgi:hypothetical protein
MAPWVQARPARHAAQVNSAIGTAACCCSSCLGPPCLLPARRCSAWPCSLCALCCCCSCCSCCWAFVIRHGQIDGVIPNSICLGCVLPLLLPLLLPCCCTCIAAADIILCCCRVWPLSWAPQVVGCPALSCHGSSLCRRQACCCCVVTSQPLWPSAHEPLLLGPLLSCLWPKCMDHSQEWGLDCAKTVQQ